MNLPHLVVTVMLMTVTASQASAGVHCDAECEERIGTYINQKVTLHGIPGISVIATSNNTKALDFRAGVGSIEQQTPVSRSDAFRLYSATKVFVTVAIFQLVDAGLLSVDTPVSAIIQDAPASWKQIRVKNLLSHSSGIPDFIRIEDADALSNEAMWRKIVSLPLDFPTGSRHSYNQTNYWLLAKIIEARSESSLQDFLIEKQFANAPDGLVFSSDDTAAIPGRLIKYYYDQSDAIYQRSTFTGGTRGLAGNGLSLSSEKLASWLMRFQAGKLLSSDAKSKMLTPFNFEESGYQFLHGLASYQSDSASAYGFSGGGVSAIRCWDTADLCIAVLTNGYKYYAVVNELVEQIAWLLDPSLIDAEKQLLITQSDRALSGQPLSSEIFASGSEKSYSARFLNSLGYRMLYAGKHKTAVDVFKKATREFPDSWNAFDSLGEALATQENHSEALVAYQKALALKPGDARISEIIQRLKEKVK